MTDTFDCLALLKMYARKVKSPLFTVSDFLQAVDRDVRGERLPPVFVMALKKDTQIKVKNAIADLVAHDKLAIRKLNGDECIYVPSFYADTIDQAYVSSDVQKLPFPNEQSLHLTIPIENKRLISVDSDLMSYLNETPENPNAIIVLKFSEGYDTALALAKLFPHRILYLALVRLQDMFQRQSEQEFYTEKLINKFKMQEHAANDFIVTLKSNANDSLHAIETSDESTYSICS
jgi:hypothetical protein